MGYDRDKKGTKQEPEVRAKPEAGQGVPSWSSPKLLSSCICRNFQLRRALQEGQWITEPCKSWAVANTRSGQAFISLAQINSPGEKWIAMGNDWLSKQGIHPLCCCERAQLLNSRKFQQPQPKAGKAQSSKLLGSISELNARSSKDQVKKRTCALSKRSSGWFTGRENWKREERTPKSRRDCPAPGKQ